MSQEEVDARTAAMRLFAYGQEVAAKQDLILVDTKYEFGRDPVSAACEVVKQVVPVAVALHKRGSGDVGRIYAMMQTVRQC